MDNLTSLKERLESLKKNGAPKMAAPPSADAYKASCEQEHMAYVSMEPELTKIAGPLFVDPGGSGVVEKASPVVRLDGTSNSSPANLGESKDEGSFAVDPLSGFTDRDNYESGPTPGWMPDTFGEKPSEMQGDRCDALAASVDVAPESAANVASKSVAQSSAKKQSSLKMVGACLVVAACAGVYFYGNMAKKPVVPPSNLSLSPSKVVLAPISSVRQAPISSSSMVMGKMSSVSGVSGITPAKAVNDPKAALLAAMVEKTGVAPAAQVQPVKSVAVEKSKPEAVPAKSSPEPVIQKVSPKDDEPKPMVHKRKLTKKAKPVAVRKNTKGENKSKAVEAVQAGADSDILKQLEAARGLK